MNNKISVGKEFIKYLFNDISLENYFFPIISIAGDGDCIFVNKFITSFFLYIGKYIRSHSSNKNKSNYEDVKLILMNRRLEMAVFDTNSKTILNEGIFYKKCNELNIEFISIWEDLIKIDNYYDYFIDSIHLSYSACKSLLYLKFKDYING